VAVKRAMDRHQQNSTSLALLVTAISLNTMSHHHHVDPDHHSSEHKHDYAKANAEHFDKESKNQEMIKVGTELAQMSTPYILKYCRFDKETTEVLDFAAGWGMSVLALRYFRMHLILSANRFGVQTNHAVCQIHPWS
jgi:hypothetical protein